MDVMLSRPKHPTVGMCVCPDQLKIDEAMIIRRRLDIFRAPERSLASLGMTEENT
jgi:hypothetical protein